MPDRRLWTEDEIESELRAYCCELGGWPPSRRFAADGKAKLYRAASMYGGVRHWQFLLDLSPLHGARRAELVDRTDAATFESLTEIGTGRICRPCIFRVSDGVLT